MDLSEEDVETLIQLDLTHAQAKTYLAMIKTGIINAKKISEITAIARPHVYEAFEGLEKKVLIEKALDKKAKIRTIPLSEGIEILIRQKERKDLELAKNIKRLTYEFKQKEKTDVQEPKHQFVWVSKKNPYIEKRLKEINNAQTSIDFITPWKRFPRTMFTFCDVAEDALKRNVDIRVILEKIPEDSSLPNDCDKLLKFPNYSLRLTCKSPLAVLAIFDQKKMIIDTRSETNLAEVPALWTDNPSVLLLATNYFELIWKKANSYLEIIHNKEQPSVLKY
jgi:sugar-specific transcriptional regulator TrmB